MKRKSNQQAQETENRLAELLFQKPSDLSKKLKDDYGISKETEKSPAWFDEDDEMEASTKLKDTINRSSYIVTLKQKYKNLIGTPKWASLNRIKMESDEDESLRSVGHIRDTPQSKLSKEYLELKHFPRINLETKNEGPIIKCLEFHPSANVCILGGQSGIVSLFTLGGETSKKLHSFQIEQFPISNIRFNPDGSDAYVSSNRKHHFYVYNLVKAEAAELQLPRVILRPNVFELSPCGTLIAVADGYDNVYIVDACSKELIKLLKQNSKVEAVSFSHDSKKIFTFDVNGVVTTWDLTMFKVAHKFTDEGCIRGSVITTSPCGRLLATGSSEGIVNVYDCADISTSQVQPVHTLSNLRAKISGLKFNSSTEILAFWSSYYPNAIKLAHIPSYSVYANFPDQTWNFKHIQALNFSPNSGFVGLCNNNNYAHLYRLNYFKNY